MGEPQTLRSHRRLHDDRRRQLDRLLNAADDKVMLIHPVEHPVEGTPADVELMAWLPDVDADEIERADKESATSRAWKEAWRITAKYATPRDQVTGLKVRQKTELLWVSISVSQALASVRGSPMGNHGQI